MNEREYVGHVANLASNQYHAELVSPHELDRMLDAAAAATAWADAIKRSLFYGADNTPKTKYAPTSVQHDPALAELVHGIIGLFGEAGELMQHLHDVMSGTEPLDLVNIVEEMGDAHWYLALLHKHVGKLPSEVWDINIAKLRKRFPNKFTEEAALNRDLDGEREVLEQSVGKAGA
jgi:hypothetical protein